MKTALVVTLFITQCSYCSHAFKILIPSTLVTLSLASHDQENKGSAFIVQTAITCAWSYVFFHYRNRFETVDCERLGTRWYMNWALVDEQKARDTKSEEVIISILPGPREDDIADCESRIGEFNERKRDTLQLVGINPDLTNQQVIAEYRRINNEYTTQLNEISEKKKLCGVMSLTGILSIGYFFYTMTKK